MVRRLTSSKIKFNLSIISFNQVFSQDYLSSSIYNPDTTQSKLFNIILISHTRIYPPILTSILLYLISIILTFIPLS